MYAVNRERFSDGVELDELSKSLCRGTTFAACRKAL
jgi:hypothetical protein